MTRDPVAAPVEILPPLAPNHAVAVVPAAPPRRRLAYAALGAVGLLALALYPRQATPPAAGCGYYVAADGVAVRRPCGDWRDGGRRPTGATARCGDGTWSYSRRPDGPGTCSGHGGVVRP